MINDDILTDNSGYFLVKLYVRYVLILDALMITRKCYALRES
jgi:hypothetical protein